MHQPRAITEAPRQRLHPSRWAAFVASGVLACACAGPAFRTASRDDGGPAGAAGRRGSADSTAGRASGGGTDGGARASSNGDGGTAGDTGLTGPAPEAGGAERDAVAGRGGVEPEAGGAAGRRAAGFGGIETGESQGGCPSESAESGRAGAQGLHSVGAAGGSGGDSGCAGVGGAAADASDHTRPAVEAVYPAPDAKGVDADTVIRVTFSEPMSTEDVERALDTSGLADDVRIDWEDAKTLTLEPTAPLPYANGSDPTTTTPRRFDFVIGTGARDVAGNALEAPLEAGFWTHRRITTELPWRDADQVTHDTDTDVYGVNQCAEMMEPMIALRPAPNLSRAYIAFDVVPLLDTALLPGFLVESAELHAVQGQWPGADPQATYDDYGPLTVEELPYESITRAILSIPGTNLGDFCTSAETAEPRMDITEALSQDLSNRVQKLLYAVRYTSDTREGSGAPPDGTLITCSSIGITLTFLLD